MSDKNSVSLVAALLVTSGLTCLFDAAYGADAADLDTSTTSQTTIAPAAASPAATSPTTSAPITTSPAPSVTSSAPEKSAIESGDLSKSEPVQGPLLDKRLALRNKISEAQKKGIGTSSYWTAYKGIEQSVQKGEQQDAIAKRIDSLTSGLSEQLKRSQDLKTQRPTAPVQLSGGSHPAGGGGMSALSSMDPSEKKKMYESLKNKYGDKIPGGIDPSTASKFLNSEQGKELMKKFGGGQ